MISVIIPMYNSKDTVIDAIESVLSQTRIDLVEEIIVVDDGSTDESGDIVKKAYKDNAFVKVLTKKNGGVSTARNLGIQEARGNWIALLDSDDIWLPEKIEKQWKEIENNEDVRFIGCGRNDEELHWGIRVSENLFFLDLKHLLIRNWPHTSTALIHKNVLKKVGLYNEERRYAEDGELWNRIALQYKLYYIPQSFEIAGKNKHPFGESGLSANLKEMHVGNILNIRDLYLQRRISIFFYIFLLLYYNLKYLRRIVVTKIRHYA